MKRFLILLLVAAGALTWASFSVPSNAAVVNGQAITQNQLNADVTAIANSAPYSCYLNGQTLAASQGQQQLPVIDGVGQSDTGTAHTTATSTFVAAYLDTVIGHQFVYELAARHHIHITSSDLASARIGLEDEITQINSEVASSAPQYACGSSTKPLTGAQVLASTSKSFVNEQVRFDATTSELEQVLSGLGSSEADQRAFFDAHRSMFDTTCFTVAQYSSAAAAQAVRAKIYEGASFATLSTQATGGGPQGCDVLYGITSQLPPSAGLASLATGVVSAPIEVSNQFLLLEITSRSPTPFATARTEVERAMSAVQQSKAQTAISSAELAAHVEVDPRYGTWQRSAHEVIIPSSPLSVDVLNALVNTPQSASPTPTLGQSG